MQASPFSFHELHINNTKTIQKPKAFPKIKTLIHKLCIHIITLYKWRYFSRSQTPPYILTKRKLIKKFPKTYPPHDSPNNQKETKSHGSPSDSTINHKKTPSHGSPSDSTINHKKTTSHGSPSDSTINHKKTTSHGAHDISQCIMKSYIQLTPSNNYLSNCVIKLHMKLLTPNLPLNNCVIKLHMKLLTPNLPLSNCVIKLHMKLLTPNLPLSNCVIKLHIKLHCHLVGMWLMLQGLAHFNMACLKPSLEKVLNGVGCTLNVYINRVNYL
jgi:hypothetical protein